MRVSLNRWVIAVAGILLMLRAEAAAPANDNFASAEVLNPAMTMTIGTNIDATEEAGEPTHAGVGGGMTVWWIYDAQQSGYLTVSTLDSVTPWEFEMDTVLAIYTGTAVDALTLVGSNDDDPDTGSYGSKLLIPLQAGTRYYIAVDGWDYEEGPDVGYIVLNYSYSPTLPKNEAPDWNLPTPNGAMLNSTNFDGKVTLVNFWATWCVPCIDEIPDLIEVHHKYERFGFAVIGISIDNAQVPGEPPSSLVGDFASNYAMDYPVVMTRPTWGAVENAFGNISAIPTTFLVDRENNIVRTVVGSRDQAYFEALVKPYLFDNIQLNVRREVGETVIEWPSLDGFVTGAHLERMSSLGQTWLPFEADIIDDGTTASMRIPESSSGFFRLRITP